jgi:hypothetical protein
MSNPVRLRNIARRLTAASLLKKEALVKAEEVGAEIRTLHKMLQNTQLDDQQRAVLAKQLKALFGALATGALGGSPGAAARAASKKTKR